MSGIVAQVIDFLTHRRSPASEPPRARMDTLREREAEAERAAEEELSKLKASRLKFDKRPSPGSSTIHSMIDEQDRLFKEALGNGR